MDVFVHRNDQQHGPYTWPDIESFLASGSVALSDFAWATGEDEWQPLADILPRIRQAHDNQERACEVENPVRTDNISHKRTTQYDTDANLSMYVLQGQQKLGPYTRQNIDECLASGSIAPTDLSWADGVLDWKPLSELLESLPPSKAEVIEHSQPVDSAATTVEHETGSEGLPTAPIDFDAEPGIYLLRGEDQYGPYALAEVHAYMRSGEMTSDDIGCTLARPDWQPLSAVLAEISALFATLEGDALQGLPPPHILETLSDGKPESEKNDADTSIEDVGTKLLLRRDAVRDFWWLKAPSVLNRFSTALATQIADGAYLSAWPIAARILPLLSLVVGLVEGAIHMSGRPTYTGSIIVMSIFVAISALGAGLGFWLCIGYSITDFFYYPHGDASAYLSYHIPLLIAYFLLFQLLTTLPLASRGLRRATIPNLDDVRLVAAVALQAALAWVFTYLWAQGTATLIRPVFVWQNIFGGPSVADIQPLQENGWILACTASVCAGLRVVVEHLAYSVPTTEAFTGLVEDRLKEQTSLVSGMPRAARLLFASAGMTFVISGILTSWTQDVVIFAAFASLLWLREGGVAPVANRLVFLTKVPMVARIVVGTLCCAWIGKYIFLTTRSLSSIEFLPIILGTFAIMVIMALLVPESLRRMSSK